MSQYKTKICINIFVILFAISIIATLSCAQTVDVYSPEVCSIVQIPHEPPETLDVEVTVSIADRYGQLVNVTLFYSINSGDLNKINMELINGDLRDGTYRATIPKQPVDTTVDYYVFAKDNLGYEVSSSTFFYIVTSDKTEPVVTQAFNTYNIQSWGYVAARFTIRDYSTGVRNATLTYYIADRAPSNVTKVEMRLAEGNKWLGMWEGMILPQQNGTNVIFYVDAYDYASNHVRTIENNYTIADKLPYLNIDVSIRDMNFRTLETQIRIKGEGAQYSPDRYPYPIKISYSYQWYDQVLNSFVWTHANFYSDFLYNFDETINFTLPGEVRYYPYDYYFFNLNITVPKECGEISLTSWAVDRDVLYNMKVKEFSQDVINLDNSENNIAVFKFELHRMAWDNVPFMYSLFASFAILSSTHLIKNDRRGLAARLLVYIAVFVFGVDFYFKLAGLKPPTLIPTIADIFGLLLILTTGVYLIVSVFGNSIATLFEGFRKKQLDFDSFSLVFPAIYLIFLAIYYPRLELLSIYLTTFLLLAWGLFASQGLYYWKKRKVRRNGKISCKYYY